ncbi:hypothetical protein IAU60_004518 [Kwoniella sp. DSM 27419]
MFSRAARSIRPLTASARRSLSTSTSGPSSSSFNRNLIIGGATLAISAAAITSERRRVLNDDRVRESVLDQDTLKRPIHKRDSEPQNANTYTESDKVVNGEPRSPLPKEKSGSSSSSSGSTSDSKPASSSSSPSSASAGSSSGSSGQQGFPSKTSVTRAQTQPETVTDKAVNFIQEKIVPRTPDVTQSVLDQPSLKAPLHKRETVTKANESSPNTGNAAKVIEDKSAEASQPAQGAFNEETGEINWDCPCLGGMADGPCGEEFKAAFSCFIYSEAEPKGVDCVEKFKGMQDCFRAHPEVYGEEIDDDEQPLNTTNASAPSTSS